MVERQAYESLIIEVAALKSQLDRLERRLMILENLSALQAQQVERRLETR